MNSEDEDSDAVLEELRRSLIDRGVQQRDLAPLPGEAERAEQRLAEIVQASQSGATPAEPPEHGMRAGRTRRARWIAVVASAAAIAVALIVPWSPSGPKAAVAHPPALLAFDSASPGDLPATTEPATDVLLDLARRSRAAGSPSVGPVQHIVIDAWWSSSGETTDGMRSELVPVQRQTYFLPDGSMRSIERRGDPLGDDGTVADRGDWDDRPIASDETFEGPHRGPDYAENLPTGPEALRKALVSAQDGTLCAPAPGGCLMGDVIDLHFSYVPSPALTSALWEVMAQEPTIYLAGTTHDRLGREAVAFMTRDPDGANQQLVLADPETGAFLGEETVLVEPIENMAFVPPAVTSFSAIVEARRIASADVPPPP